MNALIMASEAASTGIDPHTMAIIVGGGIFVALMVLLLVTVSYTNVGLRHADHDEVEDIHRQFKVHGDKH
ncbi:hypothetical protein CQ010_18270 [Arthrobacter sp. MYb211]|uniref:hypothetical protein n=1 Tax=Glutamicibacter sp. AOP12-B1-11 TaxID=3457725 RepID=UPI000CFB2DA9|nr:hypothetical protein CQ017_01780 [Arthrobacter sp. MYb224]PRA08192.1 hypothetical protein CQ015_18250 [Arthrobacter sp. MYb221]PRC02245.1 hypothetical protein CQ010_18270 [Arthrobacter sp. MYb211]